MSGKITRYGAVPHKDEQAHPESGGVAAGGGDTHFDADRAYYLKDDSTPLTSQERCRKLALVMLPILAAALIVGGSAFMLWRDFGYLYPGRNGEHHRSSINGDSGTRASSSSVVPHNSGQEPGSTLPSDQRPSTINYAKTTSSASSNNNETAACSAYPKCAPLGGDCCPTREGVILDCCNS